MRNKADQLSKPAEILALIREMAELLPYAHAACWQWATEPKRADGHDRIGEAMERAQQFLKEQL